MCCHAVQLAEVFEADIDGIMRSLGYCCGRKHIFSPQVLCCYGKQLCAIPRDTVYYNYQNRYVSMDIVAPRVGLGCCKRSPSHFLAECHARRLNQGCFVLLYFVFSVVLSRIRFVYFPVQSVSISHSIGSEDCLLNEALNSTTPT